MAFFDKDIEKILITKEELDAKVKELGAQITNDYKDKENVMVLGVLKGSVVFLADLIRAIDMHVALDFMAVSSYGSGTTSSGAVKIIKDIDISLEGKNLIIVEDILDSGVTLSYLKKLLLGRNPESIKIVTLLDKPSRRKADIVVDYSGFEIPDEFVVGYGLDYDEKYRNYPSIGILKPSVYSE